jgi:hypothetical protein
MSTHLVVLGACRPETCEKDKEKGPMEIGPAGRFGLCFPSLHHQEQAVHQGYLTPVF